MRFNLAFDLGLLAIGLIICIFALSLFINHAEYLKFNALIAILGLSYTTFAGKEIINGSD